jgi:hypothetical protein
MGPSLIQTESTSTGPMPVIEPPMPGEIEKKQRDAAANGLPVDNAFDKV